MGFFGVASLSSKSAKVTPFRYLKTMFTLAYVLSNNTYQLVLVNNTFSVVSSAKATVGCGESQILLVAD